MRTFTGLGFDPAPGSVADVETVLARIARGLAAADESSAGLRRAARPGDWRGPAAAAFRAGTGTLAGGMDDVVHALRSAGRAVSAWQSRLVANQREAEVLDAMARPLRAAAAQPGAGPEIRAELDRVLGRAQRLAARHLRQAAEAARAVRSVSSIGSPAGWPAGSADVAAQLSGRVTWWTGDLAVGLAAPVWPPDPAAPALPGVPGVPLGEEGGSGFPGLAGPGVPDLPSGPGAPGLPDLSDVPALPSEPGLLPGGPELVDGSLLPGLADPAATTSAGLLDTGSAPALRPDHLPTHRPVLDPHPAPGQSDVAHRVPARLDAGATGDAVRRGTAPVERVLDQPARSGAARETSGRAEHAVRETHGRAEQAVRDTPARSQPVHHDDPGPAPRPDGPGRVAAHVEPVVPQAPAIPAAPGPAPAADPAGPQAIDRTVEQHATPPPPAEQRPPDQRSAAPAPVADRPVPDQAADRSAPRGQVLEPGRFTAADPSPRPPAAGTPAGGQAAAPQGQPTAVKGRGDDDVLAAVLAVPGEQAPTTAGAGGLRAFLLTRPDARPVLVLIRPGSGAEPLFLTGLTPCAGALPDCAAPVPAHGPTTVY
jgi:hypothetical protein